MPISVLSVKSIFIEMKFGDQLLSSGTAFLTECSKGHVLITNRHNVTGRHQSTGLPLSNTCGIPNKMVVHQLLTNGTIAQFEIQLTDSSGTPYWFEHPTLGSKADFVLIPMFWLKANQQFLVKPYKLRVPGRQFDVSGGEFFQLNDGDLPIKVEPSDRVSVIGFPFGIRVEGHLPIWSNGFVASEPEVDVDGLPVFLIDCRSRPGQSGSPVVAVVNSGMVNLKDCDMASAMFTAPASSFLGIYSGRISTESDLGYVWKASAIREMVLAYDLLLEAVQPLSIA